MGSFGSTKTQKTISLHKDQSASGSGVVNAPTTRNSGNQQSHSKVVLRGRSTLQQNTTIQGVDPDKLESILNAQADRIKEGLGAITPSPQPIVIPTSGGTTTSDAPADPVGHAIDERLADNVTSGAPSEQGKLGVSTWLLIGGGVLVLVVVAFVLRRKKKP